MVSYDCFGMPPKTRIWVIQKWGLNLLPSTSREVLMKRLKDLGFPKGSVTPVQVTEGFSGKTGMSYPLVKSRYSAVPDSLLNSVISPYRENNLVALPAIFSPLKEKGYLPLAFESDIPVKVYKAGLSLGDCGLLRGGDGNLYIGDVNTFCGFYIPAASVVYEESKDVCYWFQDAERPMPSGIIEELESLSADESLHAGLVRIAYQGYWLPPRVCSSEKFSAYLEAKGYSDRNVLKWTSEESVLSALSMTKEELEESLKSIASESEGKDGGNGLSFDDIYQTDKNGDGWVLLDLVSEMAEYRKHTKMYVRKVLRESVVAQGLRKDLNEAQGSVKKVSQLESQVATLTQQLKSASGDKESGYSQQINGLTQSLLEKQGEVTSLRESLGATEESLKEVQSKLDDATTGLTEKSTALDKANEKLHSLKDALASAKKTAKSSSATLDNVKKELKAVKTKYAESQATLRKQQEKYAEAQAALQKQQEPDGVQDMGDFSVLMVRSGEEVTLVSDSVLESLKVLAK